MFAEDFLFEIHFLREEWLYGLIVVPVFLTVSWLLKRRGKQWSAVIAPELVSVLLSRRGEGKRTHVPDLVATLAVAIFVVALAGPSWEKRPQPVERAVDDLVIVLDLSYSMFVEDIPPNRMSAAKFKITDLLKLRAEGSTALIAYAGDAHIVTPLTHDVTSIQHLLNSLNPNVMPIPGSNVQSALESASELLASADARNNRILLFTDGIEQINDLADIVSDMPPISIIGVGTSEGGEIPVQTSGGEIRALLDDDGQVVRPRLRPALLNAFARSTGGTYATLTHDDSDIAPFYDGAFLETETTAIVEDREYDDWVDASYLLAVPLLVLGMFGIRRGALVVLPLVIVVNADAGWFEDLWTNRDRQGYKALQDGKPQIAAELFKDEQWRGVAEYRRGEFEKATELFELGDNESSLFNLGNSLAHRGDIAAAIQSYEKVLESNPQHQDAIFNRELLQKLLDQQNDSGPSQNQSQQSNAAGDSSQLQGDSSDQAVQPQQAGSDTDEQSRRGQSNESQLQNSVNNAEPSQSADREESEPASQRSTDTEDETRSRGTESLKEITETSQQRETEEALERLLRRVPEESGNLLRNKFRYDTSRRLRNGEINRDRSAQSW